VPVNEIFLRYTLQNLIIAVGLRAKGGLGELLEVIQCQKMLGLSYAEDMNIVHFQKLIAYVKSNQKKEQLSDRKM
jgi:hypothetical protein